MESFFTSVFFFIISFGVLITFHEFGHFWVARKLGVKVLRFCVGYGKPIWKKQYGPDNTEYVIAALPLGGYVKMLDEREAEVDEAEVHRAFNRQPLSSRTAIVAAGPIFNFLLAIAAYWIIFMLGVTTMKPIVGEVTPGSAAELGGLAPGDEIIAVGDQNTLSWSNVVLGLIEESLDEGEVAVHVLTEYGQEKTRYLELSDLAAQLEDSNVLDIVGILPIEMHLPAIVGFVEPDQPADLAGIQEGDELLEANGEVISHWAGWVEVVREHPGETLDVLLRRGDVEFVVDLTPAIHKGNNGETFGRIGAGVQFDAEQFEGYSHRLEYGLFESLYKAVIKTWDVSILTLKMLYNMIFGEISFKNLSGPLSIAQFAGDSASVGLVAFLTFLAVVSVSLGVLNLLPIPILDGGHLMFYFVEFVKGSPVSPETEMQAQHIGIILLLITMTFAFYNDLNRIFS